MANKTQKELLEEQVDRLIKEHGPDDPLAKAYQAQIASLGTVRHPSQLAVLNSKKRESFHGAVLDSAPTAPSEHPEPAMRAAEEAYERQAMELAKRDR